MSEESRVAVKKSNFVKIVEYVRTVFLIIMLIKYLILLLLQCVYIHLKNRIKSTDKADIENNLKLNGRIVWVRQQMCNIGSVYRETATTGVIVYSVMFSTLLMFFAFELLYKKQSTDRFNSSGFILFLSNERKEFVRIHRRIDELVYETIRSNLNYMVIDLASKRPNYYICNCKQEYDLNSDFNDNDTPQFNHTGIDKIKPFSGKHIYLNKLNLEDERKDKGKFDNGNIPRTNVSMAKQLDNLIGLFYDKSTIWPINRVQTWKQELIGNAVKIVIVTKVSLWTIAVIVAMAVNMLAEDCLKKSSNINDEERYFNRMDIITMVDLLLIVDTLTDTMSEKLGLIFIMFTDQMKQLNYINRELRKLIKKICQHKIVARLNHEDNKQDKNTTSFDLDSEAIRLYIYTKLFKWDLNSTLKNTELLINQQIFCIGSILFPVLVYLSDLPPEHSYIALITWSGFMVNLDATLFLCAQLHVGCVTIIKNVWSFVAQAKLESNKLQSDMDDVLTTNKQLNNMVEPGIFSSSSRAYSFLHSQQATLVTQHTILLWHRIIENNEQLMGNLQAKLFNTFALDYNRIIKINFGLVSLFLLSLTYINN